MRRWIGRIAVALALLIAAYIPYGILKANRSNPTAVAIRTCQDYVKSSLKAPATAVFAPQGEQLTVAENDSRIVVTAYVDAQNGFGANIRTHYVCSVWKGENNQWRVEKLDTTP